MHLPRGTFTAPPAIEMRMIFAVFSRANDSSQSSRGTRAYCIKKIVPRRLVGLLILIKRSATMRGLVCAVRHSRKVDRRVGDRASKRQNGECINDAIRRRTPLRSRWMMRRTSEDRGGGMPASRSTGFDAVTSFFERSPIQPVSSKTVNIIFFVSHICPKLAPIATVCLFSPQ
jgi:hypothetical protein